MTWNTPQVDELEQAHEGNVSKDHFVNDQKCARNVKMTKNIRHGTVVESFAIAILNVLIDCEFPLNHCSLPWTMYTLFDCFPFHS